MHPVLRKCSATATASAAPSSGSVAEPSSSSSTSDRVSATRAMRFTFTTCAENVERFSAHVVNVNRIARVADTRSLVLLDELGSATDPEEGAALAVAVAEHF